MPLNPRRIRITYHQEKSVMPVAHVVDLGSEGDGFLEDLGDEAFFVADVDRVDTQDRPADTDRGLEAAGFKDSLQVLGPIGGGDEGEAMGGELKEVDGDRLFGYRIQGVQAALGEGFGQFHDVDLAIALPRLHPADAAGPFEGGFDRCRGGDGNFAVLGFSARIAARLAHE